MLNMLRLHADKLLTVVLCATPLTALAQTGIDATAVNNGAAQSASTKATLPRELGKPEEDIQIDVARYQVNGLSTSTPDTLTRLAQVTAPYTGTGRSFEDLVNAVAAVTRLVQRDLGYYVGFAYLPEQPAGADGVVHIQVLEGRLDQIRLQWPEGGQASMPVRRDMIERYLSALKPGDILRARDVERVAFLINDLRGISTRFEIEPGREAGTASLIVIPQAESRVATRLELDTLGSRYTGVGRLGGVLGIASPLGRGDALVINSLGSLTGGLRYGGISYVSPVGAQGLKLGASVSKVNYELDRDEFPQNINGEAVAGNAFALYPLVRSRNLNLFAQASYEHKRFTDRQSGSQARKNSHDWQVGLLGDFRDRLGGGAINTYEVNWLQGRMQYDEGPVPAGLKRHFGKATMAYSRLQNLVSNRLQLYARYKGQVSNTSLDATERFSVGGPSAVRAFGPGEASADTGHVITAELRWLPPEAWLGRWSREVVLSAFYDWGHAKFSHDASLQPAGTDNTATLSAHGIGLIWERPSDMAFRLHVAWRGAGDAIADPQDHQPRANAVLSKTF